MFLGQYFEIFDWFIIYFTENNGMAFGFELGGELGKLILTLTRIFIVVFAVRYLLKINLSKYKSPVLVCFGLILGGAIGNIVDCLLYGVVFNDSYNNIASLFPEEGGYSSMFFGKVVDMLMSGESADKSAGFVKSYIKDMIDAIVAHEKGLLA